MRYNYDVLFRGRRYYFAGGDTISLEGLIISPDGHYFPGGRSLFRGRDMLFRGTEIIISRDGFIILGHRSDASDTENGQYVSFVSSFVLTPVMWVHYNIRGHFSINIINILYRHDLGRSGQKRNKSYYAIGI